jgi:hypothetical protein
MPEPLVARVVPSKVRPEPMRRVFTPRAPLPAKMPESVVEPVPPYTPLSVVVALTTPLIAWSGPVSEPMVSPPLKVLRALYVLAVVVENAVVKTPVALLYASGYVAESDDEEILLVKSVKSVEERYPF